MLRHRFVGQEVQALWQEYEDNQTAEAVMVKDFDKASQHCLQNASM